MKTQEISLKKFPQKTPINKRRKMENKKKAVGRGMSKRRNPTLLVFTVVRVTTKRTLERERREKSMNEEGN